MKALITGVTGQDGSYLAEFLIEKGYEVHGVIRRASNFNTNRIEHIYEGPEKIRKKLILHYGDLTDSSNLIKLVNQIKPDEIYNLGAQSHVAVSFDTPEYTANVDALGALRLLEAIRLCNLENKTKYYQASSSEMFGMVQEIPQTETTPFYPRSPYAVSKLFAHWITINYRESYGLFACSGILFNHESPRRGLTFVTRKITEGICNIALGNKECLYLGNLDSLRDWGHARDYIEMQWLMMQKDQPDDYVIATGRQVSVRDFLVMALKCLEIEITFEGEGLNEVVKVKNFNQEISPSLNKGDIIVRVDERYYRPAEVDTLLGDSTKAMKTLGWSPKVNVEELAKEMIEEDFKSLKNKK